MLALLLLLLLFSGLQAQAAELILNEYNAVSGSNYLNGGDATMDSEGGTASDSSLGRIAGNGGDWFELVVIADQLDITGWKLRIYQGVALDTTLVISNHAIWTNLKAGTIITIAEDQADDVVYAPIVDPNNVDAGDWTINVQATNGGSGTYITPTNFPVNHNDWQLEILDDANAVVFGPAGEGQAPGAQVGSTEIFKLEGPPSVIVTPLDPTYDDGVQSSFGGRNVLGLTGSQDFAALRLGLPFPDSDGDGIPDDADRSGIAGDAPCATGQSASCDDNCPVRQNASQTDATSVNAEGSDGVGDVCQCGDVDASNHVTQADVDDLRAHLAGLQALSAPDLCGVVHDGSCTIADAVVTARRVDSPALGPGLEQVCEAGASPDDPSELLFAPDRVLQISIGMDPNDWDALRFEGRDVFTTLGPGCLDGPPISPYTFFPGDITIDGHTIFNVGVRKKGFYGSASYTKPALKVDFTEFEGDGQIFLGMDRLTLNNAKQDPSLITQCLGYQTFAAASLPSPRCNFANVTVNGQNLGIYANVESLKRPFLQRNFGDDTGNLYEGAISDFRPAWVNTFEQKTNVVADPSRADLQAVVDALEVPDVDLEATLGAVVDGPKFLTYWAIEGILAHWDSYHSNRNNFWFYFNPANGGRAEFIPWGVDAIMAGGSPLVGEAELPHRIALPRSKMTRRLYLNPATQASYLARVQELLDTVWDEAALHAEINRMEALLTPYDSDFQAHLTDVRAFVDNRRGEITAELSGGAPPWTEELPVASCFADVGDLGGTFDTTWDTLATFPGAATLDLTVDGAPVPLVSASSGAGIEGGPQDAVVRIAGFETNPILLSNIILPNITLSAELVQPGTVDLSPFLLFIVYIQGGEITFYGLLMNGSITFAEADTTPGAPVVGTLSGDIGRIMPE